MAVLHINLPLYSFLQIKICCKANHLQMPHCTKLENIFRYAVEDLGV
jgi:hypothetical protein